MTDHDSTDPAAPTPVIPLSYLERQGEPWLPLVTILSWGVAGIWGTSALAWAAMYGCYLTQNALNGPRSRALRPELIYTEMLAAIAAGIGAVAALGCLRLRESFRTTLVSTARLMLVILPLTYLVLAVEFVNRIGSAGDPPGAIAYGVRYTLAALGVAVLPLLVIRVFDRTGVRSLFR